MDPRTGAAAGGPAQPSQGREIPLEALDAPTPGGGAAVRLAAWSASWAFALLSAWGGHAAVEAIQGGGAGGVLDGPGPLLDAAGGILLSAMAGLSHIGDGAWSAAAAALAPAGGAAAWLALAGACSASFQRGRAGTGLAAWAAAACVAGLLLALTPPS